MVDETIIQPHVTTYRDWEGVERTFTDPDWIEAHRGSLHALGRTAEGAVAMLDRMEAARHA